METTAKQARELAEMILKRPTMTPILFDQIKFLEMIGEYDILGKVRKALLDCARILDPIALEYSLILAHLKNKEIQESEE